MSLIGTLSKSLGQIIRVSAAMHVLFDMDNEFPLPDEISKAAVEALPAIDFGLLSAYRIHHWTW